MEIYLNNKFLCLHGLPRCKPKFCGKEKEVEITLFDGSGHPKAYIAEDDGHSKYLWSGHAVAYMVGENIYGWNGYHLGFFIDGVVYNLNGQRVGSVRERCPYATYAEPAKYAKYAKYAKCARSAAYAQPALSQYYSDETLESFLKQGAVGGV